MGATMTGNDYKRRKVERGGAEECKKIRIKLEEVGILAVKAVSVQYPVIY